MSRGLLRTTGGMPRRYTPSMPPPSSAEDIAQRHHLALIVQFGSTVSGTVHAGSDVDVAVLFDRPQASFEEQGRIAHELQSLFPDRELDLAVLDRADPLFLKQVFERCRLLAGSPRRLAEMRIYAFKRYQDHRKYLALEREHVRRALANPRS